MMTVDEYRENVKYLEEQAEEYPYFCRTKANWPIPAHVYQLMGIQFVEASLIKERQWQFKTGEDMARFKHNYTTLDNKS